MDFNQYQEKAGETAVYPGKGTIFGVVYCALGIAGEAGEIANKVKKLLRDLDGNLTPEANDAIADEMGDELWYLGQMATELKRKFDSVADRNLLKLASRKERGTIHGNGDNR